MIRVFDVIFSITALVVLLPVLIIVMILLRLTGEGKIFFYQERIGLNGEKIHVMKFATMLENSPKIGTGTITTRDDPRILPMGKYLRKTKINELPQLLNILKGDMSVIGPRPLTQKNFSYYPEHFQKTIIQIRPGLSGIGSIIFRSEEELLNERNNAVVYYAKNIAPYKAKLESWFVENQNLKIYIALIFLTIWIILKSKSSLVWKIFPSLPKPPDDLKNDLNYNDK
jgi:Sugar transferases involved in lipopolysaccharide synthesis